MTPTAYLFNSLGEYIAYQIDQYIFDTNNNWVAWIPDGEDEIYSKMGEYLATLEGNRIFFFSRRDFKAHPGYPNFPGHFGAIDYSPSILPSSLPVFAEDVNPIDWNQL
jgi:hypothetical protein